MRLWDYFLKQVDVLLVVTELENKHRLIIVLDVDLKPVSLKGKNNANVKNQHCNEGCRRHTSLVQVVFPRPDVCKLSFELVVFDFVLGVVPLLYLPLRLDVTKPPAVQVSAGTEICSTFLPNSLFLGFQQVPETSLAAEQVQGQGVRGHFSNRGIIPQGARAGGESLQEAGNAFASLQLGLDVRDSRAVGHVKTQAPPPQRVDKNTHPKELENERQKKREKRMATN